MSGRYFVYGFFVFIYVLTLVFLIILKGDKDVEKKWEPKFSPSPIPKIGLEIGKIKNSSEMEKILIPENDSSSDENKSDTDCSIEADATSGTAPLSVNLTYKVNYSNKNINVTGIQWDFDGNGVWDTKFSYSNSKINNIYEHGDWFTKMRVQFSDLSITDVCEIRIVAI